MAASKDNLNSGFSKIIEWLICLPCLALWPFLSALPLFTLLGSGLDTRAIVFNLLLLATGFWPLFVGFFAYKYLLTEAGRERQKTPDGEAGLRVGYYATGWTIIYFIIATARPV